MAYTDIDDPSAYFQTALYTGDGNAQTITNDGNSDLQPDWVWISMRSHADNKIWYDSVRGVTKRLVSNLSSAEATVSDMVTAFNSDGFSVGTNSNVTGDTKTFVGWQWKENVDAGFDIVSYTGSGSAKTVSHSLSAVPKMIIVKARSSSGQWTVQHGSLGATKWTELDSTAATDFSAAIWNNTEPTSSVFTVGTNARTNANGTTYIAYLFAEKKGFSKMGSYKGNGNADGNFIYLGFKPALIILKGSSGSGSNENWSMYDNKRLGYNVDNNVLYPNTNEAEATSDDIDILSNGFKIRRATGLLNDSGVTYIYYAVAENPFVTSTDNGSIPATAR